MSELIDDEKYTKSQYYEFLRVQAMSAGIYRLEAGTEDLQKPHTEDEIYHVVQGESRFCIEDEDFEVQEGSIIYVPAHAPHKFHSITKDLIILVIFTPAEYSQERVD